MKSVKSTFNHSKLEVEQRARIWIGKS